MDAGYRAPGAAGSPGLLAFCFTAGVLIVHALPQLPSPFLLCAAAVPAFLPWRGRALYAVAVLGLLSCAWRAGAVIDQRWPPARHGEERSVSGIIASLPEETRSRDGEQHTWRFQFRAAAEASLPLTRVSWYRAEQIVRAGECWRFKLRLRTPHGSLNPGGFDYEAWLLRQHIGAVATVREAQRCDAAATSPSAPWWLLARQRLLDHYRQWLPEHPGLPLLGALTIGDTSGLTDADWDAFRLTGTTHLVAVSGFNVAIVAGFAFLLGRWGWSLWPRLCLRLPAQKAGMLLAAVVGLLYAFAAGWEPPVQRAALMFAFLLVAAWFDRLRQPARVLALAWIAILLFDPLAVLSPGLWLSFAAVATIFYVSGGRLKAADAMREALRVQLALTLALVPLSLFFFHGLSWATAPINLLAVPVVGVLTPIALIATLLSFVWPWAGVPLLGVTASALSELQLGLHWIANLSAPAWLAASPPPAALLLALIGLIMLLAPRGLPLRPLGAICLLPLLWPPQPAPKQGFEVAALDVGQGLAVVVRTAHHVLLYDAGPAFDEGFDAGESVVVPYLLQRGLRRIDTVMISHPDQDHIGGLKAVQRLMRVDADYGIPGGAPCIDGIAWDWDGVAFRVLHPAADAAGSDNDRSCVLSVSDARHRALLTGDIEVTAERRLIAAHATELKSDLLIAPHHGSRSSSSPAFVNAVRPRTVIFSAGWRSHFGHPRPEVVARYAAIDAQRYVTGVSGAVLLHPSDDGWQIEQYRREHRHWWNADAEP